jgi:hypothetical protein
MNIGSGIALCLLGILYLVKPTLFRRWFWMRTSIAIRTLSEKNYLIYMRGLGVVLILIGIGIIVASVVKG